MPAHVSINGPYKKGNRYQAYAYCPERTPTRKTFSLRTESKSVARQKLRKIEGEIARGEWDPWEERRPREERGPALGEATEEYLKACAHSKQAESTLSIKRGVLRRFRAHVGAEVPIQLVSASDVRSFLSSVTSNDGEEKASARTTNTYHALISGLFTWAEGQGYADGSPTTAVARATPQGPGKKSKALRPYEVDRLRKHLLHESAHYAPAIDLCAAAGLRRGEVVGLPVGHCHPKADEPYLEIASYEAGGYSFRPKRGRERRVALFPRAAAILEALIEEGASRYDPVFTEPGGGRLSYEKFGEVVTAVASKALRGRGVTLHWLRHTHATWITNEMRWSLPVAQEQLGHDDVSTTRGYVHVSKGSAHAAMAAGLRAVGVDYDEASQADAIEVGEWLADTSLEYLNEL